MISVTLSMDQVQWGTRIGIERFETAKGKPKFKYEGRTGRETHILGACGELAFCVGLGLPWPATVGTYREEPDVYPQWEVRTMPGKVKVATDDPDERLVVLVRGAIPSFQIIGYITAWGGKRNYPLTDPGDRKAPAHFVPDARLVPIEPGFHATHGWTQGPDGLWSCAFCTQGVWPEE